MTSKVYAVRSPCGSWAAKTAGHDYRTGKPCYPLTDFPHANLYRQRGAATKAAAVIGGEVVTFSLTEVPA
ncbi:MAG: hypothetical protein ACOVT5_15980 [Armatimonadaceae bacterium]